jgi:glutamate racemase
LSVLVALREQLVATPLLYLADSAHAPYGERDGGFVVDRSRRIASHLVAQGARGLVVACNTATAAAVQALRATWSTIPIVGIEPGLKPAAAMTRNGRIGVLATPGTLASERFAALLRAQPPHLQFVSRACPGLAALVEDGDLDAPALRAAIDEHTAPLRDAGVDTVVLGCTHYGFVRHHIEAAMGPGVQVLDTALPVARHAATRFAAGIADIVPTTPSVRLQTTGDVARLRRIASAWLPFACSVEAISPTSPAA